MVKTEFARRIDSSGRLVLPAKLREQLNLNVGDVCDFFLYDDPEGKRFLCIECPDYINEIEYAKKILKEHGITSL